MHRIFLLAIVFGILIFGLIYRSSCSGLSCVESEYFTGFVRQTPTFNSSGNQITYTKGNEVIRVRSMPVKSVKIASDRMQIYLADISGMYDTLRAPYPGQLSQTVVCDQKFKPNANFDTQLTTLSVHGVMSKNEIFGVCDAEEAQLEGLVEMIYCGNSNRLYVIELHKPYDNRITLPEKIRVSCR